jgi:hypothetical protein
MAGLAIQAKKLTVHANALASGISAFYEDFHDVFEV